MNHTVLQDFNRFWRVNQAIAAPPAWGLVPPAPGGPRRSGFTIRDPLKWDRYVGVDAKPLVHTCVLGWVVAKGL